MGTAGDTVAIPVEKLNDIQFLTLFEQNLNVKVHDAKFFTHACLLRVCSQPFLFVIGYHFSILS
jgi:hypothetical protein